MSLDENIFGYISNFLKKRKREKMALAESTVHLNDVEQRMSLIAKAITGAPIDIYPAEREGGYKNNHFFLPQQVTLFSNKQDNEDFYLFRVLFLSFQKNKNLNFTEQDQQPKHEYEKLDFARKKSKENAFIVTEALENEFDWAKNKQHYFLSQLQTDKEGHKDTTWLYGKWMTNTETKDGKTQLQNFDEKIKKAQQEKIETILKAKAVEEIKSLSVDKKQQEAAVLNNYFEKIETLEEFGGSTWRDFDGEDELEEHQDALDEVQMKQTVRVDDTAHSVYQSDFIENTSVAESAEIDGTGYHIKYDEWDFSKSAYKPKYCKVYPTTQIKSNSKYYRDTIRENQTTLTGLRKMLASVNNRYHMQRRQNQGEEFDLDALTDLYVSIHSGHSPEENVYLSKKRKEKELSILFLLDISLSSDSYANNNRVIDVEKQVSILFGEILNEFGVDFSISCFFSKTRNHTRFLTLKDFDEKWDTAKHKIGEPQPQGYTRIGPALRHAGAVLKQRDSKNKWIIFLSDGKPNDYDKYEGKYGVNDVKQALRELNQININTYAMAIEATAKYYLPQMFGNNHYEILTTPIELLQSLAHLYDKLKYGS